MAVPFHGIGHSGNCFLITLNRLKKLVVKIISLDVIPVFPVFWENTGIPQGDSGIPLRYSRNDNVSQISYFIYLPILKN